MAGRYQTLAAAMVVATQTLISAAVARDFGLPRLGSVGPSGTIRSLPSQHIARRAASNQAIESQAVTTVLDLLSNEKPSARVSLKRKPPDTLSKALAPQRLMVLISACAPSSPPSLVRTIVLTESSGYPLRMATNGLVRRAYSPANREAAVATLTELIGHGANVDIGLMQLNSRTLAQLHIAPTEAFDPCRNISIGAKIFDRAYAGAFARRSPTSPLWSASSIYNTGDPVRGLTNGYAGRIQVRLRTVAQATG